MASLIAENANAADSDFSKHNREARRFAQSSFARARALTEEDAARYIGMSTHFLEKARQNGRIGNRTPGPAYVRIGGGRAIRYLIEDLDAWLEKHRQAS